MQVAQPKQWIDHVLQMGILPDAVIRWGIRQQLADKLRAYVQPDERFTGSPIEIEQQKLMAFIDDLKQSPLAIETDAANAQHYEVPAEFYAHVLGPHYKYSSALWQPGCTRLADAEQAMLACYLERAQLKDGQRILELGCGWGSLSLYMAQQLPNAQIVAMSNSSSQREFIQAQAQARGLNNLTVMTANITAFEPPGTFDRIVSVEMMEHLKNYDMMFNRLARWLNPLGKVFIHIFTHRAHAYHYEDTDGTDWLTRHFFAGGTMPSASLFHYFQQDLRLEAQWAVSGTHYEKTANAWLKNMDANRAKIMPILVNVYGPTQAKTWWHYWRIFMMACAELWGYQAGEQWQVSHYRFVARTACN
ncbi:MAG: cyclopropane-fatty-acyl-phospholipid synthase family protein [Vampirovibrionales bacterium]|nr:cyclopropane-fatty-acyl-phospholipid synthase family protein [Vampirovibrionales bacterium]